MNYINGKINKILFKSDNGYTIAIMVVFDTDISSIKTKTVTITGYFHEIILEDNYKLIVEEINHPKYGQQYNTIEYEHIVASSLDGLAEYLSSPIFPGIGKTAASLIVEKLGMDAIKKIEKDQKVLDSVPKLTIKQKATIVRVLKEEGESHLIVSGLVETGFKMRESIVLYNKFGSSVGNMISENIYSVLNENDLSFLRVDEIGKKMYELEDKRRVKAAILYVIKGMMFNSGDTYLYFEEIVSGLSRFLGFYVSENEISEMIETIDDIYIEDDKYFIYDIYEAENYIANRVHLLNSKIKEVDITEKMVKELEKDNSIEYNSCQLQAIKCAINNNVSVITGGPGTGKTTIVKAIIDLYKKINDYTHEELYKNVSLLTPTGRASKRLNELTNHPAMTIHRFLKWNMDEDSFNVNEYNKDNSKLVIVDEASMLDAKLFSSLLKGLRDNVQIVLVGDDNQLPSVGEGQVLKDLIDSDMLCITVLDILYRQSDESYIPILANGIRNGEVLEDYLERYSDYRFLETDNIVDSLKNIASQLLNHGYNYKDIQVLVPMYGGVNGIDNLNVELQKVFNPSGEKNEVKSGYVTYREGDKVIYLINNPDDDIFNGDIGIIKRVIDRDLLVDFLGTEVLIKVKDFKFIKHAFVISVHKAQGSEYDIVLMPVVNAYSIMLYRKLIYTGITRAKKKLFLLGSLAAFSRSICNNANAERKTILKEKLLDV